MRILQAFFRTFTHAAIPTGSLEYTRNILRIAGVLLSGSASFIYLFASFYFQYTIGIFVSFFLIAYHLVFLYLIKNRLINDVNLAHVTGVCSSIAINTVIYTTGFYGNSVAFWMLGGITYAFSMGGARAGLFWTASFSLQVVCMFYFKIHNHLYLDLMPDGFIPFFAPVIYLGVFGYIAFTLLFFDHWRKTVIQELNILNNTKDRMISMIGHDLKNPLNLLMGIHKYLGNSPEFNQDYYDTCSDLQLRMKKIIDNMMLFERIESKNLVLAEDKNVCLNEIINKIINENHHHTRTQMLNLAYNFQQEIILEASDSVSLERIFSNLISNAIKYSPKGTKIEITSTIENDRAIIKIKDEGIGIESTEQKNLFQIYQKGSSSPLLPSSTSSGIGLYIVKYLVELLNGSISVYSEGKSKGCEFTLSLPLKKSEKLNKI